MNSFPIIVDQETTIIVKKPYSYQFAATVPVTGYQYSGNVPGASFFGDTLSGPGIANKGTYNFIVDGLASNSSFTTISYVLSNTPSPPKEGICTRSNVTYFTSNGYVYTSTNKGGLPHTLFTGAGPGAVFDTFANNYTLAGRIIYDSNADVFYTCFGNPSTAIIRITPAGACSVYAGSNVSGFSNDTGAFARFNGIWSMDYDAAGNLYVYELGNSLVRKIDTGQTVTTYAGTQGSSGYVDSPNLLAAKFSAGFGLAVNRSTNDIYLAEQDNSVIRKISPSGVTTLAGSNYVGTRRWVDGTGTAARFYAVGDVVYRSGDQCLYATDFGYIRRITLGGTVTTIAGSGASWIPVISGGPDLTSSIPMSSISSITLDTNQSNVIFTVRRPNSLPLIDWGFAYTNYPIEVRPAGSRPTGSLIVATSGNVTVNVVTSLEVIDEAPVPIVDSSVTLYKYEAFSYIVSNVDPAQTISVTASPELTPFITVNPVDRTVSFVSLDGFQRSYSSPLPLTINAILGSNIIDTLTISVQVLAGRFKMPAPGTSNDFYVNETISPITFESDASLTQISATPSLPPGLFFVQQDPLGFEWQLRGVPAIQSVPTTYNIIGKNVLTGRTVSVSNVYRVDPERVLLDLSGSSNVVNMAVGTPIDTRQITATILTLPYTFRYTWPQSLPNGLTFRDSANNVVTSGFSPLDTSNTIRIQGTPTLAAAQFFAATSNAYAVTLNAVLSRGTSTIITSVPFTFSFGETVLFTQQPTNVTLYDGDTIDSNNGYVFSARTFFTPGTVGISNIFSPDLRSDLSLQFVGGPSDASAYLVGTSTFSAPSQPYTVRAVNSNGFSRDTTFFLLTQPDIVTFTPPTDLCSTFIFSRPLANAKPGYYNSPIRFRATATSGNTITYTDGTTLVGTGLSLSNVTSNNSVQLVGTPIATLGLTTLTITGTAAQSGASASTSVQISIVPDSATWTVTPSTPSEFIQNEEIVPYQFRATTLSELPVSYYSSSNLPLGLSLSSTGRLTGTPTTPGSGVATVIANTGYSALTTTFAYTVLKDAILFAIPPPYSRPIVPNQDISPIQVTGLSYTGNVASNYTLNTRSNVTLGISVSSNGVIDGTLVNQEEFVFLYPEEPLRYTVSAVAGNVTGSFDFLFQTSNSSRLRTIACTYDGYETKLYYTNRASLPVWETVRPAGTYWYDTLSFPNKQATCLLTVGNLIGGQAVSNATTNVYLKDSNGCLNYYTSNGTDYESVYTPNIGDVGTIVYSAAKNYDTNNEVYAIGRWYDFSISNAITQAPIFVVSTDNGLTFDNFTGTFIDSNTTADGTNFYASSNAPNGEGIVIAHVQSNFPIVGGAADASGNHSILYGIPQTSIYDICWNPVANEFLTITTDIRAHYRWDIVTLNYRNVYFLGSDKYDPYAPSWTYTGAAQTIRYAPISFFGGVVSNVLSNAPTGFNVLGLKFYGFLQGVETTGLWATGISHDGTGFIPELRVLANDFTGNWLKVDLSTNPLFSPSLTKPDLNEGYGPIFFSGQENPLEDPTVYVFVRRNGTTELYTKRTPTADWTLASPFPFSGTEPPFLADTGITYQFDTPSVSLEFPNQTGPPFPAQELNYLLYQYGFASITIVPPTPEPNNPYLYVRDQDLPPGLRFNALTGVISGYPTTLVANQAVTVYALQRTSQVVSFLTIYITVVNPFVVRPQMSAAAYTALLRQYTLANAVQNARDTRIFAGAERNQGAFGAGEGPDVTTQVNTGCDPNCPPIVIPTVPFSPLDVDGCRLWLDASDSVVTGSNGIDVIRWNDKSGYGNHATDVSGGPTLDPNSIGGKRAVYFEGDSMYGPLVNTGLYATSFAVVRSNPGMGFSDHPILSTASPAGTTDFVPLSTSSSIGDDDFETSRNNVNVFIYVGDGAQSTLLTSWYDGTLAHLSVNGTPSTSTAVVIGGNFSYNRYGLAANPGTLHPPDVSGLWEGYMGEVLVYHTSLTIADRQKVEGYLAWKWGLEGSLPSNHPYKNAPP